jgi:hypothetical protein
MDSFEVRLESILQFELECRVLRVLGKGRVEAFSVGERGSIIG